MGNPNAGKTSLFNRLTGLRAKTGNYPGVTVARHVGSCEVGAVRFTVEDLPGTYSLEPISPDEEVVLDVLDGTIPGVPRPDVLAVVLDATTIRRSLRFLTQVLEKALPTCVVVTFTDELARRGGSLDVPALERALGVPVACVVAHRRGGHDELAAQLARWQEWPEPLLAPPTEGVEQSAWVESVLAAADYSAPHQDRVTGAVDAVLLHPLWGTLTFFAVMALFFQAIFVVAAPLQGYVESLFGWLGGLVADHVGPAWLASLLGDAVIGGIGGVLVFVPQIMLLFLLLALLEASGYLARAAFLMDRVMSTFGLEGRAFVALLSSFACAVPGIMATRSLPSARDRIATMMGAPLMTCSARLPVYVTLIGILVPRDSRVGPLGVQGLVMFGLYLLGAVSAMLTAALFKRIADRGAEPMPFYLELPTYRLPVPRSVLLAMWEPSKAFLRKCTTVILGTTLVLWMLLNLPLAGAAELRSAGLDPGDPADAAAVSAYVVEHSVAADLGRAVGPVFDPLGFDWRVNVAVLSSFGARETFVATLSQVDSAQQGATAAEDEPPGSDLGLSAGVVAALLVFYVYALQCVATMAAIRRETGSWRWPAVAWGYMFVLAWTMALLARTVTGWWAG
ncbi:ferrous iron transporter B [Nocardioides ferulae]|uniref:ferrous iron transporter B n=1 Tax=Nocardioides ferulae TaxID=2340821 RepID=UPI001980D912|nr:ferrous iron transporter B [Nocardioides ferulae]